MSRYLPRHDPTEPAKPSRPVNRWAGFNRTAAFLYGPDHAETRKAATDADVRAWRRLGRGRAAT
jgi:hypothetical protein